MIEKIRFWDHCIHGKEPVECYIIGEVSEEHVHYLVVKWWTCEADDEETSDINNEYAVIIRSAIIKRTILVEDKDKKERL